MAIKIITDSTSDITQEQAREKDIIVMPLTIYFGEQEYQDGIDLDKEKFFEKLKESKELPTTSQVNFSVFEKEFEKHLEQGDEVIGIFLSSELSGTCQSAKIAKENLDSDKIHVIDSRNVTFCLELLVKKAVELRDAGKSAAEITEELQYWKQRIFFLAVLEDLTYLKKGGRLSAASATVGALLGVKPIVTAKDGKIEVAYKVRGVKNAYQMLIDKAVEAGLKADTPVIMGHGQHEQAYEEWKGILLEQIPLTNVMESRIGSAVGTYAGPQCLGLAFFLEEA